MVNNPRTNVPALPAPNPGAHPGDNRNITGVIQTIFGGIPEGTSKSALKAQARRIPPQEPVHKRLGPDETFTFSEADAVPPISPHTDALVIQAILANKEVHRVHIDQLSRVVGVFFSLISSFFHNQSAYGRNSKSTSRRLQVLGIKEGQSFKQAFGCADGDSVEICASGGWFNPWALLRKLTRQEFQRLGCESCF